MATHLVNNKSIHIAGVFADIDELKGLNTSGLPQFIWAYLDEPGTGEYYLDLNSSQPESLPNVVAPTSGSGRWIRKSDAVVSDYNLIKQISLDGVDMVFENGLTSTPTGGILGGTLTQDTSINGATDAGQRLDFGATTRLNWFEVYARADVWLESLGGGGELGRLLLDNAGVSINTNTSLTGFGIYGASLRTDHLTDRRIFQFPDTGGTIAITSEFIDFDNQRLLDSSLNPALDWNNRQLIGEWQLGYITSSEYLDYSSNGLTIRRDGSLRPRLNLQDLSGFGEGYIDFYTYPGQTIPSTRWSAQDVGAYTADQVFLSANGSGIDAPLAETFRIKSNGRLKVFNTIIDTTETDAINVNTRELLGGWLLPDRLAIGWATYTNLAKFTMIAGNATSNTSSNPDAYQAFMITNNSDTTGVLRSLGSGNFQLTTDAPGRFLTFGTAEFETRLTIQADGNIRIEEQIVDISEVVSIDTNNRSLTDISGQPSVVWGNRELYDSANNLKLDWENGLLYGFKGAVEGFAVGSDSSNTNAYPNTLFTVHSGNSSATDYNLAALNSDDALLFGIQNNGEIKIMDTTFISASPVNNTYVSVGFNVLANFNDPTMYTGNGVVGIGMNVLQALPINGEAIGVGHSVLENNIGSRNIGVGKNVGTQITTGNYNVLLGYAVGANTITGNANLLLGEEINSDDDYSNTFGVGHNMTMTSSNQIRFGGIRQYKEIQFNSDVTDSFGFPAFTTRIASVNTATDTAGWDWIFEGSKGTGNAQGGAFQFKVAPAGSAGTTQNTLVDAFKILGTGEIEIPDADKYFYLGEKNTSPSARFKYDDTTPAIVFERWNGSAYVALGSIG